MNKILLLYIFIFLTVSINQTCIYQTSTNQSHDKYTNNPFQNSCPQNSQCLSNGYCACNQDYIGSCAQKGILLKQKKQLITNITSDDYVFFRVTTISNLHTMLIFTLCHTKSILNVEQFIQVWYQNGQLDILNQSTAIQGGKKWPVNQGCIKLNTPFMVFNNQANGRRQEFILGIKLTQTNTTNTTNTILPIIISVQIQIFDFWGLLNQIILIMGGCLLFSVSIGVIYIIYKWRRRNYKGKLHEENDLSHFQKIMPKMKLNKLQKKLIVQDLCSICLLDLNQNQWIRKTTCEHVFHQQCLDQWCQSHLSCPICRSCFKKQSIINEGSCAQTKINN